MDGDARSFPCASLLAEAEAILASLWASGFNSGPIIIESNCKRIIDAIIDPSLPCVGHGRQRCGDATLYWARMASALYLLSPSLWLAPLTLIQVRDIASSNPHISFEFVRREDNRVAHWVASQLKLAKLPLDWRSSFTVGLVKVLEADRSPSDIG